MPRPPSSSPFNDRSLRHHPIQALYVQIPHHQISGRTVRSEPRLISPSRRPFFPNNLRLHGRSRPVPLSVLRSSLMNTIVMKRILLIPFLKSLLPLSILSIPRISMLNGPDRLIPPCPPKILESGRCIVNSNPRTLRMNHYSLKTPQRRIQRLKPKLLQCLPME